VNGNVGAAVAAYRRHAGLRQQDLASQVHYSRSMVAMVEQGRRPAKPEFLAAVAPVLWVDVDTLTGGTT
jgi:transcriptional regulator with XRE-family HTH domain